MVSVTHFTLPAVASVSQNTFRNLYSIITAGQLRKSRNFRRLSAHHRADDHDPVHTRLPPLVLAQNCGNIENAAISSSRSIRLPPWVGTQSQESVGIPIFVNREISRRSFCAPQAIFASSERWSPGGSRRASSSDRTHGCRESPLGSKAHPRRIGKVRV